MTFVEHVLEFLLVVTLFGAAVLAVAFFVTRSYVRRHWRLVRGHVITRGLVSGLSFLAAGRERWSARATPEQLSQGTAARVRRRMWTAVEDAEIAVAHADSHDAPVAELPVGLPLAPHGGAASSTGSCATSAGCPAGARPEAVRRQVADVITAARDVQSAALGAGGDAAAPRVRALVQQAGDEVQIVSAAVSRLRSLQSR